MSAGSTPGGRLRNKHRRSGVAHSAASLGQPRMIQTTLVLVCMTGLFPLMNGAAGWAAVARDSSPSEDSHCAQHFATVYRCATGKTVFSALSSREGVESSVEAQIIPAFVILKPTYYLPGLSAWKAAQLSGFHWLPNCSLIAASFHAQVDSGLVYHDRPLSLLFQGSLLCLCRDSGLDMRCAVVVQVDLEYKHRNQHTYEQDNMGAVRCRTQLQDFLCTNYPSLQLVCVCCMHPEARK